MTLSRLRFPLLAAAILTLIFAVLAGLMRLGWKVPTINASWMAAHGPLMISGFLGTLISIERVVALGKRWMYAGPALSALGGLGLLAGIPLEAAQVLIILGSLGLVVIFGVIVRRHMALYTITMALGAAAWLAGNFVWWNVGRVPAAAPWWMGFLVLTIAGERLELGRLANHPRWVSGLFLLSGGVFSLGWVISIFQLEWGNFVTGLGMAALAIWLMKFDIARMTVRKTGLTRFIAVCMLSGYVWLAAGGILLATFGGETGGAHYDAALHAIFLGFVFSMIFGHAPIIFPAILGVQIQYSPRFYFHLAFLHLSLMVRITGGLADLFLIRRWGGMLNGLALLIFILNTAWALWMAQRVNNT